MDFLKGWKTKLGALGEALGGLAMIVKGLTADDGPNWEWVVGGFTVLSHAISQFGLAKKGDRIEKAVNGK